MPHKSKAKSDANVGPSFLGLHTLIGPTATLKMKNLIENIMTGYVAPFEIIAQK